MRKNAAFETSMQQLLFDRVPADVPGLDERGKRVYRKLVRGTIGSVVKSAIPHARRIAGEAAVQTLIDRWLEAEPPQTRKYWELPIEFGAWIMRDDIRPTVEPDVLAELIHWETIEVAVLQGPPAPAKPQGLTLHPATRMGVYRHPVHRIDKDTNTWPEPTERDIPWFVLIWRHNEKAYWRELPPAVAQTVVLLGEGKSLEECIATLRSVYRDLDAEWIHSEIETLVGKGAVLRG